MTKVIARRVSCAVSCFCRFVRFQYSPKEGRLGHARRQKEITMQEHIVSDLAEYCPEKFVAKPVYESAGSKAMLLHLLPGQEVPNHPHPNWEVALIPQRGEAVVVYEDETETFLKTGAVY